MDAPVASSLTTREVVDRLLGLGEPISSLFEEVRRALTSFDREVKGHHRGGNMDYMRGEWDESVRALLVAGRAMEPSLEADPLAFAQELRDYFKRLQEQKGK